MLQPSPPAPLPPDQVKRQSRQILGLDLLRAAAAYLVMLFHYTVWNWAHNPYLYAKWPAIYRRLSPFTSAGWVGVEIFFVISGYIITYSIAQIGPAEFVRHRITRLFPSALICASITACVYLAVHYTPPRITAWLWLRSVTFWPLSPWIDGSYWTLPIEIAFYFLVLLCLITRRGLLSWVMATVGLLSSLSHTVLPSTQHHNPILLLTHGCFFAFGVFLYESLHHGLTILRTLALLICMPGCLAEILPNGGRVPLTIWLGGVAFLIGSVLLNDVVQQHLNPSRRFLVGVIRRIGLMTYPLYLVHDQIGNFLIEYLHISAHVSYGWALVVTMAAMTALASLIVQFGEPPVRRALLRIYPSRLAGYRSKQPATMSAVRASRSV